MGDVGILILVDQNVFELGVILGQHIRIGAEHVDRVHQQVAEIAGVEGFEPLLIIIVELAALAIGKGAGVAFGNVLGGQRLVLPAVDHHGKLAGRPALVVETLGLDQLLDEANDVIGIEDGEIALEADQFCMTAQQLDADGVERAEPWHALDRFADQMADALLHLARGLVGEGHGKDLRRIGAAGRQNVGNAGGENTRFAGSGTSQHEHRAFGGFHGAQLFRIEAFKVWLVGWLAMAGGHGTRGNAEPAACGGRAGRIKIGYIVKRIGHCCSYGRIRCERQSYAVCMPRI